MRLALLSAFLAIPIFSQEITITYDQATITVEKTLAKVYPKDLKGYFVQACNWTSSPLQFNPEWMLAKASGVLQVQSPERVLVAAQDTRNGSKSAMVYRGVQVAGIAASGFAAGGLIEIPTIAKYLAGGIPILAPLVKDGLQKSTQISTPTDWVTYGQEQHQILGPGDCVSGTIAAAAGGPKSFSVKVSLGTSTVTESKTEQRDTEKPAPIPASLVTYTGRTHPESVESRIERYMNDPSSESDVHELAEMIRGMSH